MSGAPVRVALQEGADVVRVAAGGDGAPWLLAELPAPGPGTAALLAELVGPAPEELVLLHPGRWPDARAREWAQRHAGLAARVRAVPAPLAAAGRGGVAVLDVGAAGAEAVLLAPDGGVRACATADVGGRTLDALLAARWARDACVARELREALSLLPVVDGITADELDAVLAGLLGAAVDALRAVLAGAPEVPVLLVGGVARSPLLARLVDAAGITGAVVAPRPDAAAVLGALAHPGVPPRAREVVVGPDEHGPGGEGPGAAVREPEASAPVEPLLPPLPPRRHRPLRTALRTIAATAAVALLLAAGRLLAPPGGGEVAAGVLVQYGYRLDVPAGWEHTGGLPERRRVLLTPVSAPEGSDLIAVESSPLGYDVAAEPERARAELRAVFDTAVAHGSALSGYDPDARFAGRVVTSYRQQDGRNVVDWFVVLDGDAQLSVGCRHTAAGAAAVAAACAVVVGSVRGA
ncbi:type VII secretion-associated protein [Pseudonocardia kunmingensis]|uniref:Type VII secretion-associated protein (TIGR03931 family) n=1 Tax=Pseudonocardia kunmingensis TaxID=630975 RepID=A0A543E1B9_9PSEU|nr:type VII secretion-associated protein [Pseudonocardia kunmingensis]TQM15383.1 type VII secretion-associated protein (TIGR03931 family) [Pseudonocardia kunmingensis]